MSGGAYPQSPLAARASGDHLPLHLYYPCYGTSSLRFLWDLELLGGIELWRARLVSLFCFVGRGLCPLMKFHFWKRVVNKILWTASLHKVFFINVVMFFFKCSDWRVCTKESLSFAFLCSRWVTRCKECVLECLRWFEVRSHIENCLLVESLALVYCGV